MGIVRYLQDIREECEYNSVIVDLPKVRSCWLSPSGPSQAAAGLSEPLFSELRPVEGLDAVVCDFLLPLHFTLLLTRFLFPSGAP